MVVWKGYIIKLTYLSSEFSQSKSFVSPISKVNISNNISDIYQRSFQKEQKHFIVKLKRANGETQLAKLKRKLSWKKIMLLVFTERSTTISAALEADWQPEVTYRQTDIAISARSGGASSYRWHWTAFRDWGRASSSSGRECSPVKTLNSRKRKEQQC